MSTRTAVGQQDAARAALTLVTTFPALPAPAIRLDRLHRGGDSTEFAWGVHLAIHDGLCHFEQWREALGLDPAEVAAYLDDDSTNWLDVSGTWAGVPVLITGYFTFLDPEQAQ